MKNLIFISFAAAVFIGCKLGKKRQATVAVSQDASPSYFDNSCCQSLQTLDGSVIMAGEKWEFYLN